MFIFSNPKRIAQVKLGPNFKVILEMQQKFQKDNLNGVTYRFQPIFFSNMLRVLYTHRVFLKHHLA